MAVGHRLPNGYVVVLMTPREATLLRDQLLEPGDFPWDKSESQMIGMEVRQILTAAVSDDALMRLREASNELINVMEQEQAKQNQWQCNHCGYEENPRGNDECINCGHPKPQ